LEPEFVPDEPPLLPLPLLVPELDVLSPGVVVCVPPEPTEVRGLDAAVDCAPGLVDSVVEELEAGVPGGSGFSSTSKYRHVCTIISRTAVGIKILVLTAARDHPEGSPTAISLATLGFKAADDFRVVVSITQTIPVPTSVEAFLTGVY
jgi:hypothetical protein